MPENSSENTPSFFNSMSFLWTFAGSSFIFPANSLIWVTKNKKTAKRYGNNVGEYYFDNAFVINPDDGDGGILLLNTDKL